MKYRYEYGVVNGRRHPEGTFRDQEPRVAAGLGLAVGMLGAVAASQLRRVLFRRQARARHDTAALGSPLPGPQCREIPAGAHPSLLARLVEENVQLRDALVSLLNDKQATPQQKEQDRNAVAAAEAEVQELRRSNHFLAAQVDQLEENLWVLKTEETRQVGALRRELEEVTRWAEYMEQEYSLLEAEVVALSGRQDGERDEGEEGEAVLGAHLLRPESSSSSAEEWGLTGQNSPRSVMGSLQRRLSNSSRTRQLYQSQSPGGSGVDWAAEERGKSASSSLRSSVKLDGPTNAGLSTAPSGNNNVKRNLGNSNLGLVSPGS